MKIVILSGSPHKHGTSAALVDAFIKGAKEAGHCVARFDTAFMDVHPCIACDKCKTGEGKCVFSDDMTLINGDLLDADCVVFASPIYYSNMCAQLKTVIDRFYASDDALHGNKKTILLTTMAEDSMDEAEPAISVFRRMAHYLNWEIAGCVNAAGCFRLEKLSEKYTDEAYQLGTSL